MAEASDGSGRFGASPPALRPTIPPPVPVARFRRIRSWPNPPPRSAGVAPFRFPGSRLLRSCSVPVSRFSAPPAGSSPRGKEQSRWFGCLLFKQTRPTCSMPDSRNRRKSPGVAKKSPVGVQLSTGLPGVVNALVNRFARDVPLRWEGSVLRADSARLPSTPRLEDAAQDARAVTHQTVHADVQQPTHVVAVVDGPHMDL